MYLFVCVLPVSVSLSLTVSVSQRAWIHVTVVCVTRIFQLSCLFVLGHTSEVSYNLFEIVFAIVLPIKALITGLQSAWAGSAGHL